MLSFTVFAAAIALALIIVGAPNRQHLVSPGALTSQHSQVVDHCEDCHTGAAGGPDDWIRAAFDPDAALRQSSQCLRCHTELGPNAKQPHGQELAMLAELTKRRAEHTPVASHRSNPEVTVAKSLLSRSADSHTGLACATCHSEHRGAMADLKQLTNQQCQVCHVESFHGFSDGHPEFTAYPYERRTRLYFDHLSHYGKHFATAEAARGRNCRDCHKSDTAGRYMLVRDFESTCAECHSDQIHDDTTLGLAAISLPAFDVDALLKAGRKIGQWPRNYPLHVEAESTLSPLQGLLLQSYEGYSAIAASLSGIDLGDLQEANSDQLQAVESFVWMLKESLYDIVQQGHPEVHKRLTTVLGGHVSAQQITALANSYPLLMVIDMQREWLPALVAEVEAHRAGTELPPVNESLAPNPALRIQDERRESAMLASGWYLHGSSLSLRYRPNGHADPLLKTLLDVGVRGIVSSSGSTRAQSTLYDLFDQVSSPFAAGRCMKCHSVDREPSAPAHVNWHPYQPPLNQHKFTRFSHAPHVTLLRDDACSECHSFSETQSPADSVFRSDFIGSGWRPATNPHNFESNFVPMSKTACAQCHSDDSGRDRCLTCHNYHVR